jgi:hypothetical protein
MNQENLRITEGVTRETKIKKERKEYLQIKNSCPTRRVETRPFSKRPI